MARGVRLTILSGNHEPELSLPGPRRILLERLGPGRVEFVYDNQAWVLGDVLIEHGNRYDAWNYIDHNVLREIRSCSSRRESPQVALEVPGSELVVRVMNQIKQKYAFVDMLKPEGEGVIPLLAVLEPSWITEIGTILDLFGKAFPLWIQACSTSFDRDGKPEDRGAMGATAMPRPDRDERPEDSGAMGANSILRQKQEIWEKACQLAGWDPGLTGVTNTLKCFCEVWHAARSQQDKEEQIARLYSGLREFASAHHLAFDIDRESETYLIPATAAARRKFKVVVYGHTHLPKRIPIHIPGNDCMYFNTGTWADIMQLPEEVLGEDEAKAKNTLTEFVSAIANNQIEPWRKVRATFVRIDMDGNDRLLSSDLFQFEGARKIKTVEKKEKR